MSITDCLILLSIFGAGCMAYVWVSICDSHKAKSDHEIKRCKTCGGSGFDLKDLIR